MSRSTLFDITERKKLEQRLQELSNTDALTGLCNRRHFQELAAIEIERVERHGEPLAAAMLDVDHFKRVNDTHGHPTGDELLRTIAEVFRHALRKVDIAARFGGEEFVILMPQTDLTTALGVMERLRATLQSTEVRSEKGVPVHFTVSIGVSAFDPAEREIEPVLGRADAALYAAKGSGRNRVCTG